MPKRLARASPTGPAVAGGGVWSPSRPSSFEMGSRGVLGDGGRLYFVDLTGTYGADRLLKGVGRSLHRFTDTLEGSFSAVSKPIYSFCNKCQGLEELHTSF